MKTIDDEKECLTKNILIVGFLVCNVAFMVCFLITIIQFRTLE